MPRAAANPPNDLKGDKTMRTNIKEYIMQHYTGSKKGYGNICFDIYTTFRKELYNCEKDFQYFKNDEFNAFTDWMQGGPSVFDTDYYIRRSAVKDLFFIIGEENICEDIFDESKAGEAITYIIYVTIKELLMRW